MVALSHPCPRAARVFGPLLKLYGRVSEGPGSGRDCSGTALISQRARPSRFCHKVRLFLSDSVSLPTWEHIQSNNTVMCTLGRS